VDITEELTAGELRRALRVVHELADVSTLDEFPVRACELLRDLIRSDHAGYNVLELEGGGVSITADPSDSVFDGGPELLMRFAEQNPLIVHYATHRDPRALRLSDFITRRELHRTEIYQHVYRWIPLECQLAVQLPPLRALPGRPGALVGLSLGRARGDFTRGHARLLEALRPHFAATLDRLRELTLARAIVAAGAADGRALVLVEDDSTVVWVNLPAAALGLIQGCALPAWVREGAARAEEVTLAGRRLQARMIRDVQPGLDAVVLTNVPDLSRLRAAGLTARQAQVLSLALAGRTTSQIAQALQLSTRTVEKHWEGVYVCLGISNRTQAIVRAVAIING
jgi:DNA-binding CsgD family transcriptional regulator